jgi:hypothetical protein
MNVDTRSFPESICTHESKSICGRGGHHKLLLFWNLNVTGVNATPFRSCPSFLSNKIEHMFPLSKMNKKLGTRIPDCSVGVHEPE